MPELKQGGVRLWVAATVNHVSAVRTIGARYTPRAHLHIARNMQRN
jgi:hypothetical protein